MRVVLKRKTSPWSKFEIYDNCKQMIGTYFTRRGQLYTGLEDNLTEKLDLEERLKEDLSANSGFWKTFNIVITSNTDVVLHDIIHDPWDRLKYLFLKNHKNVQNGPRDRKPNSEYILISEEDSAKVINKEAKVKVRAFKEFGSMTPDEVRKALRLYGFSGKDVSNEIVESTLYQLIEDNPDKFIELWVENKDKEFQYIIEEAVSNNIIRKNKTVYKYGTDILGHTLEETIDYLRNPSNSDFYHIIKDQIEGKKRVVNREEESANKKSEVSILKEEIAKEEEVVKKETKTKKSE
jgi:hypothetical protein